ncbi:MAG: aminomethyl-transferring glycine dehydrogenase subunit GcvPA [Alphaproteobacteria bacterium]|nr:aminomethyl-transferring glycine dehydrogenase subunit GcvPA [Alphaproteobacteria bacterium]
MRYLPLTKKDRSDMLAAIGVKHVDDLFRDVPRKEMRKEPADIALQKGELEVERIIAGYANQNQPAGAGPFFLGAGIYNHHIPSTVDYIIQRSEFLTAYTPYQPEIAQGTLQVIFEYQSMICQLTGMDIANASLYDGATSLAEAALMAMRLTGRSKVAVHGDLHPHYHQVLGTYLTGHEAHGFADTLNAEAACLVVQYPDFRGEIPDLKKLRAECDKIDAKLVVVVTEIVALGLLPAPVEADIVCGEGQSLGLPMSYGGPHLGIFACREAYLRQMPGRLCGETVDADGRKSYVLTLSTREQHIRRDKATSNICTNQGLCALAFTVHLSLLGEAGFKHLAQLNHERACALADAVAKVSGIKVKNKTFFNEFAVELPYNAKEFVAMAADMEFIAGYALEGNELLLAATEMTTDDDIKALCLLLAGYRP